MFDKYWQGNGGTGHGHGLGLYIVKRIVEAHGGAVSCESEVGQGTAISFTLWRSGRAPEAR